MKIVSAHQTHGVKRSLIEIVISLESVIVDNYLSHIAHRCDKRIIIVKKMDTM